MFFTRILNAIKIPKHTNEFTGIVKESPDRKWGRRKIKMMSAHYYGRHRNCYRLASRKMKTSLDFVTKNRELARRDFKELCDLRIQAGATENHYNTFFMRETLARLNIGLNRKVLANLAMWEPRSFRSIIGLCAHKENLAKEAGELESPYPLDPTKATVGPGTKVIDRKLF